jgi:hypothetical protein
VVPGVSLSSRCCRVVHEATRRRLASGPHRRRVQPVPPEQTILLACALADRREAVRILTETLPSVTDWQGLREAALQHGVAALLYRRITESGSTATPPDDLQSLHDLTVANERRSLRMSVQLVRLIELLSRRGLTALPVKGPVLAETLYGDTGLRHFVDLDVAIRPRDVAAAGDVARAAGFRQVTGAGITLARLLASESELTLESADGELAVDLHWRLGPRFAHASLPVDDLIANATTTTFLGRELLTMAREDLFVAMCVHGAHNHRWNELEFIAALGAWGATAMPSDWLRLLNRAARLGCRRRVTIGCLLMREMTGVTLPAYVDALIARDALAVRLARAAREALFVTGLEPTVSTPLGGIVWESLCLDRAAIMPGHFVVRVLTPGAHDWDSGRIPSRLPGLYYLSRPVRLAGRLLKSGGAG